MTITLRAEIQCQDGHPCPHPFRDDQPQRRQELVAISIARTITNKTIDEIAARKGLNCHQLLSLQSLLFSRLLFTQCAIIASRQLGLWRRRGAKRLSGIFDLRPKNEEPSAASALGASNFQASRLRCGNAPAPRPLLGRTFQKQDHLTVNRVWEHVLRLGSTLLSRWNFKLAVRGVRFEGSAAL